MDVPQLASIRSHPPPESQDIHLAVGADVGQSQLVLNRSHVILFPGNAGQLDVHTGNSNLAGLGLGECSFGFIQPAEGLVRRREVGISAGAVGIKLNRLEGVGQSIIKLAQPQVDVGNVVVRNGIARISLFVKLERGDAFVELAGIGVIVRSDVKLLMFAGPVTQLKSFFAALFGEYGLAGVVIDGTEPGIRHGEIWIKLDRSLI